MPDAIPEGLIQASNILEYPLACHCHVMCRLSRALVQTYRIL